MNEIINLIRLPFNRSSELLEFQDNWKITLTNSSLEVSSIDKVQHNMWSILTRASKGQLHSLVKPISEIVRIINNTSTLATTSTSVLSTKSTTTSQNVTNGKTSLTKPTAPSCRDPFLQTFRTEQRYLCFGVNGGLGNLMFMFASAHGIANRTGRRIVIDKSSPLLKIFNLDGIIVDRCVCKDAQEKIEKFHCAFDEVLMKLPKTGNYFVGWYLQSWKYFKNIVEDIKTQFTFQSHILREALASLYNVKEAYVNRTNNSQAVTFIGVHIRRGDIVNDKNFVNFGYTVAPKEYINHAIDYFKIKFTNVIFLFVSNDMRWAKQNVKAGKDMFFIEGHSAEIDMCIIAHCNHTVMTVGTFGWFSAFLAGGVTVYYKHIARERSKLRSEFPADYREYFYPGWIGME